MVGWVFSMMCNVMGMAHFKQNPATSPNLNMIGLLRSVLAKLMKSTKVQTLGELRMRGTAN